MSDQSRDEPRDAPLNPALKSEKEMLYETKRSSPAPIDTTSARENEGEAWPIVWVVVTLVCVILAIYFLV